jgi:hypothetical protein
MVQTRKNTTEMAQRSQETGIGITNLDEAEVTSSQVSHD